VRRDVRYPVAGPLAKALGGDTATFDQIGQAALTDPSPRVRSRALRTSLRLLEKDRAVRDAFVEMLGRLDNAYLTSYVRLAMKDNAEEIMARMARWSNSPAVRMRAQGILQELRASPTPE